MTSFASRRQWLHRLLHLACAVRAFRRPARIFWNKGFADFAKRWLPILDVFEKENVNFALEVHPTEIAFDIASAKRALDAVKNHPRFGFNYDPSHLGYQGVDYVKFIREFGDRIFHAHMKDVWWGHGDGTVGVFGGHTDFTDARRFWDFRSLGHGDIKFEDIIVALNDVGYRGPLSVEWEDGRMDRIHGATESCAFVRKLDFAPNQAAFDAAFSKKKIDIMAAKRKLRYGMVGGGQNAFIGAVHRLAANLDGQIELVAGAFSSDAKNSQTTGEQLFLNPRRVYGSYEEMAKAKPRCRRMSGLILFPSSRRTFCMRRSRRLF